MRILIATGIFHPESGGPATYLYHLIPELQARGHDVTVLTFGDAPVDSYDYPVVRISRKQNYLKRQWTYYQAAARLWREGYDVAFVHSLNILLPRNIHPRVMKIVGDSAWERAVNKGWVPSTEDIDEFQTTRKGVVVELNKFLRNQSAKSADFVIVPSNYLRNMVMGWGVAKQRLRTIYNASPTISEAQEFYMVNAREQLGLPNVPTLLTVARVVSWKGIHYTLEALALTENIQLFIAGDGPERSNLERLSDSLGLNERVRFLGRVPRGEILLYFCAADYKLLYSSYEGLSHVLLESLSVGTPVIVSDKGGNPEVVKDGVNGFIVPYGDVESLADTIQKAFSLGMRDKLAANSSVGMERFEWSNLVEQTEKILLDACDAK